MHYIMIEQRALTYYADGLVFNFMMVSKQFTLSQSHALSWEFGFCSVLGY